MKFEEALAALMAGKSIRRVGWAESISLDDMDDIELSECLHVEWEIYEQPKWEPKGGDWLIMPHGVDCPHVETVHYKQYGLLRSTKEQAEAARDKMRTFNRLLAYVDEYSEPAEICDWSVQQIVSSGEWIKIYVDLHTYLPGIIRMTSSTANKLVDDLNCGRVVL